MICNSSNRIILEDKNKQMRIRLTKYYLLIFILVSQACSFNKFFYNPIANPDLKIESDTDFHELVIVNKTGESINGILLDPETTTKGTVLLIHGNSGNIDRWIDNAKYLYLQGYRVLVFDYQGYGKSTGKPNHKNVVTDTELFLDYLNTNYGKVILWGLSLGGNLSVNVAYRNPDKVKALIIEAGFTSHNQIARTKVSPFVKPFVIISVRSPNKSKKIIEKLHIPILITHSPTDNVVPFEMGELLYSKANEPKFFLKLKGDHCLGIQNNLNEYLEMIDNINKNED